MRVFVMTDMEGISGVCRRGHVTKGDPLYEAGRRFLTAEVNACVRGCLEGGADEVIVKDGHGGTGDNFLWEQLVPGATYVMGEAGRQRLPGIERCDALILLGFHAMAGTPYAVLEHTMSSASWQNFWLNGRRMGEIGIDAAIGGENGVPTILVTGDDKACEEAAGLLPGVTTACVKWGLACEGARLLPPSVAYELIAERSAEAVREASRTAPFVIEPPVTARLERVSRGKLPVEGSKPYVKVIDGRTYEVTADSVEQALLRL